VEIKYGAEVVDRHGRLLGTVEHLMHNTLTGEVSKFAVCRKAPLRDIFLSPQDVLEVEKSKIRVNVSVNELGEIA
jgi:sporulation protein YlmC with PRC-barrel domain